jgi:hypothetical protein
MTDLFEYAETQRYRRSDPDTSREAAERVSEFDSDHHKAILDAMRRAGIPLAAEQIADALGGLMDKVQIGKRMCELERGGAISKTEKKHVNRSGRRGYRYQVTRKW